MSRPVRVGIGALLIAAAVLKATSVDDPRFRTSLAWQVAGGRQWVIALMSAAEAGLGVAFACGLWTRAIARAIIALMALSGGIVAVEHVTAAAVNREPRACGCYGSVDMASGKRGLVLGLGHAGAIAVASAMVLRVEKRPEGTQAG